MSKSYRIDNPKIALLFQGLLESREIVFEDPDFVGSIFAADRLEKFDIADHVIAALAKKAGCLKTVTFDRQAARYVSGMELLA